MLGAGNWVAACAAEARGRALINALELWDPLRRGGSWLDTVDPWMGSSRKFVQRAEFIQKTHRTHTGKTGTVLVGMGWVASEGRILYFLGKKPRADLGYYSA